MNKLLLGAFLGLTIVACQTPSKNTVEAEGGPGTCPMGMDMDAEACEGKDMAACEGMDMDDMKGDCDMKGMDMEACEGKDMEACEGMDMDDMKGDCDMKGMDMDDDMEGCPMGGEDSGN